MKTGPVITSLLSRIRSTIEGLLPIKLSKREARDTHVKILRQILFNRQIDMVFQPIITLANGGILGYEALARGPAGSIYEEPLALLAAADSCNCRLEMENICQLSAVSGAADQLQGKHLFINVNPRFIGSAINNLDNVLLFLQQYQMAPSKIVLELTERTEIHDYTLLRENLETYRRQGFKVAIDDAGAGYSSLQAIAELQPDFVKMDLSLIRDIDKSPTKQAILETISTLCRKIEAAVICEGIERPEELQIIKEIGCDYGQGFLFRPPGGISSDTNINLAHLFND